LEEIYPKARVSVPDNVKIDVLKEIKESISKNDKTM
jgi:hypothetical protein